MKKIVLLFAGLVFTILAYAQNDEFKLYSNGLIYSEQTMGKLSHIVDSLNLKYRNCDHNRVFYSVNQAIGIIVKLEEGDIKAAKKDMEKHITLESFLKKYPQASIAKNELIIKYKENNYEEKESVFFENFNLKSDYGFRIESQDLSLFQKDFTKQWLWDYQPKTQYSNEQLTAFYFPENFKSVQIPQKYADMIGYSDCMIDTATEVFKTDSRFGSFNMPDNVDSMSYSEKVKLLDSMRSILMVGSCSHDISPRLHATRIAIMSAETYNWEVFLKSHLDIMNDNFTRSSDGSYALKGRKTYIQEIEQLNINVVDLLMGISFRMRNPANNHYYGSISRLGRAMSESQNKEEIEKTMLTIIADPELDTYNRLLFYFLFLNYNYNIKDETIKNNNKEKLNSALKSFPEYVGNKLNEK